MKDKIDPKATTPNPALSRFVAKEKAAQPKRATLALQRRARPAAKGKLKSFLEIDRGRRA